MFLKHKKTQGQSLVQHTQKKRVPKQCPWGAIGTNSTLFSEGHQNSARGGAGLRTIKRLQGWNRFGSTFFLSAIYFQ